MFHSFKKCLSSTLSSLHPLLSLSDFSLISFSMECNSVLEYFLYNLKKVFCIQDSNSNSLLTWNDEDYWSGSVNNSSSSFLSLFSHLFSSLFPSLLFFSLYFFSFSPLFNTQLIFCMMKRNDDDDESGWGRSPLNQTSFSLLSFSSFLSLSSPHPFSSDYMSDFLPKEGV